ncbi:radical SAM protein [Archaeoglobales archaeon]|nr:MAG: radical SAM protein [Archaeoglobales archaeon]
MALEFNPIQKKWRKELRRVALVYPNRYRGGIANIGLQQIYCEINALDNFVCERFYSDVFNGFRSVESATPINEFDIALFSLQYEQDYSKAVEIAKKFKGLKIAGGPCVMENPVPLKNFFDFFFIGEIEACNVEEILECDKTDIKGMFTGEESMVKRVKPLKLEKHLEYQIIGNGAYGRCVLLEIGRGCKRRCRFCIVRQIYSPVRWRNSENIVEVAKNNRKKVEKAALIAPSPTDHPKFKEILQNLIELGFKVSPSSLRADMVDEELVELLNKAGLKSLTLAPEAGSERMREIVNKGISEEDVINAVSLFSGKFKKIKLYFMIGLPFEGYDDLKAIVELAKKVKKYINRVTLSINPLVPKPHTPFQWLPFDVEELKVKADFLRKELRRANIKAEISKIEEFAIQTALSRGDEKIGRLLSKSRIKVGDIKDYLSEIPVDSELPWDFIDHGYKKERLIKEYEHLYSVE